MFEQTIQRRISRIKKQTCNLDSSKVLAYIGILPLPIFSLGKFSQQQIAHVFFF